jgi:hypothetical protein
MPIVFPPDPQRGKADLPSVFERLASEPRTGWFGLAPNRAPTLDHSRPHRVYTVGLDDLANGRLLSSAKPIAWRYFLTGSDGKIIGETEFELNDPAEPPDVATALKTRSVSTGPFPAATAEALQVAELFDEVTRSVFEPRFLKIAAVYFAALWLHDEANDLIVPIGKTAKGLEPNKAYLENQVLAVLQPIAQRNLEFHQRARTR